MWRHAHMEYPYLIQIPCNFQSKNSHHSSGKKKTKNNLKPFIICVSSQYQPRCLAAWGKFPRNSIVTCLWLGHEDEGEAPTGSLRPPPPACHCDMIHSIESQGNSKLKRGKLMVLDGQHWVGIRGQIPAIRGQTPAVGYRPSRLHMVSFLYIYMFSSSISQSTGIS